jgi:hypothetical protein
MPVINTDLIKIRKLLLGISWYSEYYKKLDAALEFHLALLQYVHICNKLTSRLKHL